jgi:predicted dehydrogenase
VSAVADTAGLRRPAVAPLRLAFIGTGDVAHSYAAAVRRLTDAGRPVALVAACGRRRQGAQDFALRHGIAAFADDPQAIFADPEIDAVAILTPMQSHGELAARALAAGKHVFVEKTLAGTPEAGRALADQARRAGLTLCAAPATPLSPVFRAARQAIAAGRIGRPVGARAVYGWAGPDWDGWFYAPGAGPLRDLGVYALTTLTGLLGPVAAVQAMALRAETERRIGGRVVRMTEPDMVALTLMFRQGCLGTLLTGFSMQKLRTPGIEIYGTAGTLQFIGQDWNPQGLEVWTNEAGSWSVSEGSAEWDWTEGLRDFCEALLSGRAPQADLDQTLHVLDIIAAAEASHGSGRRAEVGSGFTLPAEPAAADAPAPHRRHK